MSIDNIIAQAVSAALKALYGIEAPASSIVPQATRKEFEGDMTIVVFPWVKAARKAPEAVGREIGAWLEDNEPAVARTNTVKGFLNIVIEPSFWGAVLRHIAGEEQWGIAPAGADAPLVMVESASRSEEHTSELQSRI